MTEADWLASADPARMLAWLTMSRRTPPDEIDRAFATDRKLRLFAVALADAYHAGQMDLTQALLWVDGKAGPPAESPVRWVLYDLPAAQVAADAVQNFTRVRARPVGMPTPATIAAHRKLVPLDRTADLLRDVVGNPFRPVPTVWATVDEGPGYWAQHNERKRAVVLARGIYDERRFGDLPVLADALEEAGCDNEFVLSHLRGLELVPDAEMPNKYRWAKLRGPHVRGCWALDLVLGLE